MNLYDRRVLEVGAGIGKLTHFFQERDCAIVSTDARGSLVERFRYHHPKSYVYQADLMVPGEHLVFGRFEVVFCYGVLYHLPKPDRCLFELSEVCSDLFLLETAVYPEDNGEVNPVIEGGIDQSIYGQGCRPARNWIWDQLHHYFEYVYLPIKQPNYPAYATEWPAPSGIMPRAVFIASRNSLRVDTLSMGLLNRQERLND